MGTIYGKIEIRERRVYVRYDSSLSNEPLLISQFWELDNALDMLEGGEECSFTLGQPQWCVHTRNGRIWFWTKTELPAFGENTPIPPPKVRAGVEVRYQNGEWQKYDKRKGWKKA